MSDESPTPTLRLRPRQGDKTTPSSGTTASPFVAPPAPPPAAAPEDKEPRFKLRPKTGSLVPDTPPPFPAAATSAPAPAAPPPVPAAPLSTPTPAAVAAPKTAPAPVAVPPSAPAAPAALRSLGKAPALPPKAVAAPAAPSAPVPPVKPTAAAPASRIPGVETSDVGSFKLRPKTSEPTQVRAPALPPNAAAGRPGGSRPPMLAGSPSMPISKKPLAGTTPAIGIPHLRASRNLTDESEKPENSTAFKMGLWAILGLLLAGGGVAGYLAYNHFSAPAALDAPQPAAVKPSTPVAAKPAQPATAASTAEVPAPTPVAQPVTAAVAPVPVSVPKAAPVVAQPVTAPAAPATPAPQSTAGKAVEKARQTVAAHDAAHGTPVDEVLATPAPKPAAPKPAPTPAAISAAPVSPKPVAIAKPAPAQEPVSAHDFAGTSASGKPVPPAEYRAFVVNMRIAGVFQGEPSRVLLNGEMRHVGDIVDPKLGIKLVGIEPERKVLVFEDASGMRMSRKY